MTKQTRYGLLIAGFIFFLVGAPSLVLYVQGRKLGWGNERTQLTGIISVETKPSNARVTVTPDTTIESPGAIRFLPTGDYEVTIEKDGYYPWTKHLAVIASRVTHANPNPLPLFLIKHDAALTVATDAVHMSHVGKRILYTTDKPVLSILTGDDFSKIQTVALPGTATRILPDTDQSHALIFGTSYLGILDVSNAQFQDYTKPLADVQSISVHEGSVWGITATRKLITATSPAHTPTVQASSILAYTIRGNEIYYLQKDSMGMNLYHAILGNKGLQQNQVLAQNIPEGNTYELYSDNAKALFVLVDHTLFRINETASPVASNVTKATTLSGSLVYSTPGELWWYDSGINKQRLVSRISESFGDFYVDPTLQYAFFAQGNTVVALELDDRAGQNRYLLHEGKVGVENLDLLSPEQLLYRTGNTLQVLTIF